MSFGLIGHKVGMTRIFMDDGDSIPVTVPEVGDNRVTQIKMDETDGYTTVQATFDTRRASRVTKPLAGHLAKAGVEADEVTRESRVDVARAAEFRPGVNTSVDPFEAGQKIGVQGVTIGRGYAGTTKRHSFSLGRVSCGNSRSHNVSGPIGMAQDLGRVFPGKRVTGHMGDAIRTVQSPRIAETDAECKLLLVKGVIPGAKDDQVIATPAAKAHAKRA